MSEEKLAFGTDVSRLLDIVANALYTNRDVFLRELISNAADACDKLRYESLQNPRLVNGSPDFKITVVKNSNDNTLTVTDNGVGMNREELIENLGTIARSGTAAMVEAVKNAGQEKGALSLIGQFGVGFYASFMVADRVEVVSRKAGEDNTWRWESDGRTGYTIAEEESVKIDRGVKITLHLKSDAYDFLNEDNLKRIILAYSDHIGIPVYVGTEDKPVNAASALWMRPKSEITQEQYNEFYHHIGHVFDEPIMTSHWRAEGKIEYTALLFIPTMRPFDLYEPGRKHAVRLYVKRVFITDQVQNLIYPWLRFVRGVIDSEDLPLNISREMLQNNPVVAKIRSGVTKRILSDLAALAEKDEAAYDTFWYQFGMVVKEGLYDAAEHRDDIFKICRFFSTNANRRLVSLDDYVSRMKEGQEEIYYILGEKLESLEKSPQLEGFKSRGLEVLFFNDTIDSFWLQMAGTFKGKKFTSITKGSIDLGKFEQEKKDDTKPENEESVASLLAVLSEELKSDVKQVRVSNRLTDSPVCLIADEQGVDIHMERILKTQQKYEPVDNKKILEINEHHALIQKLAGLAEANRDAPALKDAARLLYDQACIIQGEPVNDPSSFARRMAEFMQRGLAA
ncbi:MAG TPA: molecular chaperone HtpG [Micavibrio sp.]|nr:molecular chaperone HtpG [Micavibrio sp.]